MKAAVTEAAIQRPIDPSKLLQLSRAKAISQKCDKRNWNADECDYQQIIDKDVQYDL
jgi:hypothetical protein